MTLQNANLPLDKDTHVQNDDNERRINLSVALSPKTTRTCNNKPK